MGQQIAAEHQCLGSGDRGPSTIHQLPAARAMLQLLHTHPKVRLHILSGQGQ
jgi:hypothetical protein